MCIFHKYRHLSNILSGLKFYAKTQQFILITTGELIASYADALWVRHAIFLPHERLLKRMGCLIRPITAHFPIKAAYFEPWSNYASDVVRNKMEDICVAFQRVCETFQIVDWNPFQREAMGYFVKRWTSLLFYTDWVRLWTNHWGKELLFCKYFNSSTHAI